jgi:hypothetical protein
MEALVPVPTVEPFERVTDDSVVEGVNDGISVFVPVPVFVTTCLGGGGDVSPSPIPVHVVAVIVGSGSGDREVLPRLLVQVPIGGPADLHGDAPLQVDNVSKSCVVLGGSNG